MARPFHHPAEADMTLDGVLHALSDGTRRSIVAKLVATGGLNCGQSCDDLPASTISHHHRILRDSGLIRSERRGVAVFNSVRTDELDRRFPGLVANILAAESRSPRP
ncbi:ArsR/SmtB family transcription factor [Sphingomonas montana]|uniref:ArsR/SmtB family transcription factor n=1 Tax=Sphingomonas montana TaxID=1843236 RepID=UPI00096E35F2|nr:helix-turn-helix domain-containing protein [Sphingomonas montana]